MILKHLITLILCWLLVISYSEVAAQQKVKLTGTIQNPKAPTVYIKRYDLGNFQIVDSARLSAKGDFSLTFHWSSPRAAILQHGEEVTSLFLAPGYKLSLTADADAFDETLQYSGDGALVNSYFARKSLFEEQSRRQRSEAVKLKEADFIRFTDSTLAVDKALLEVHFAGQKLNKAETSFIEGLKTEMLYRWAKERAGYPERHTIFHRLLQRYQPTPEYYDYLKRIHLDNPAALASPTYISFLSSFIHAEAARIEPTNSTNSGKTALLFEAINLNFKPGKVKFALIRETLDLGLRSAEDFAAADKFMPTWLSEAKPWPALRTEIETLYNNKAKLRPGNPAPDFTLTTAEGTNISLTDFRGKLVYMNFWASWCGGCIMAMPHAKKLAEDYKGKDVVFLNVNFDQTEKAWRDALAKHQMQGVNVHAPGGFNSEVAKLYGVVALPQYLLIGKDGKLLQTYAVPPGGMRAQLDKALAD